MNFIPIEMSHIYLTLFFKQGWSVFYEVAIQILAHFEPKLIKLQDAGMIVGQIKQARLGCEHLLMLSSSQHSLASSRVIFQTYRDSVDRPMRLKTKRNSETILVRDNTEELRKNTFESQVVDINRLAISPRI